MLRGDLAAEWGTNSGEGRQRARCVGGNFLLLATRHLLNVYIVSGAGSRRCLPVPRGCQCELSLFDLDETWSRGVCDFRPLCKQLGKEKQVEMEQFPMERFNGTPKTLSFSLCLFRWVFPSTSGSSHPNYSFLFTYVNADQRAADWHRQWTSST